MHCFHFDLKCVGTACVVEHGVVLNVPFSFEPPLLVFFFFSQINFGFDIESSHNPGIKIAPAAVEAVEAQMFCLSVCACDII